MAYGGGINSRAGGPPIIGQPPVPFDPMNPIGGPGPLPFDPQNPSGTRTAQPQLPTAPQRRNTFGINERAGGGVPISGPQQQTFGFEDGDAEDDPTKEGGGFWDWLQNNQEIAGAVIGTGAEVYGAYKEGQQADEDRREDTRRYEAEEAREDERLRRRDEAYARIQDRRKARATR